jgi:hypothetical protein
MASNAPEQGVAAVAQRSMTDFGFESALASAVETLADRQSFQLDPERWEAFVTALDAPPQTHPRLARSHGFLPTPLPKTHAVARGIKDVSGSQPACSGAGGRGWFG